MTGASGLVVPMVEKTVYEFEFGYCSKEHKDGVECENLTEGAWPQDEEADNDDALLFRSYDYWLEFKALNGR